MSSSGAAERSRWRRLLSRIASVGRWTLIVVVLFFSVIGFLQATRGTAVRHVRGVGADGIPVAPSESEFPLSVQLLTGAPLTTGNRVEVMLNGDGTYPRLWDDLRSAQEWITIQMYYGQNGRVADTLREILLERAAAGVRVLVLYDAFGTQDITPGDREAYRDAGILAVPFRPLRPWTLHLAQNRSHVRGIVVDGRVGWTGGFGIDDKWLGDGRTNGAWRDTNVRFEGPAVLQLQAAFAAAWVEATGDLLTGRATVVRYEDGVTLAGVLYTNPSLGSTAAERFLALSIAGAQDTLYFTNAYFAPDQNFVELFAAAAERGVDVRILSGGPTTDVHTLRFAGRASYEALLSAGVRLYEWKPTTLHAKTFVADGLWATIGSMNLDNRSLALNDESTLMILDAGIGEQMNAIFLDDLKHAEEIQAADFLRRPWWERILERAARLVTRLL
jgi:cardiolipin synthase